MKFISKIKVLILFIVAIVINSTGLNAQCTSGTGASGSPTISVSSSSTCAGSPLTVTMGGSYSTSGTAEYMFGILSSPPSCGNCWVWVSPTTSSSSYTFPPGTLNSTGTYEVVGCVRTYGYCSFIETSHTYITISSAISSPTSASASPAQICLGQSSTLNASISSNTVRWFDNSNATGSPVGTGTSITVSPTSTTTYYAFGYNSSTGCLSGSYLTATVSVSGQAPIPVITAPSSTNTYTTVSVSGGGLYITDYNFNFGSNAVPSTATGAGPHSVYWTSPGTKTITLTASNNGGACTEITTKNITVNGCPVAIINAPTSLCSGVTGSFTAQDQGSGVTYSWTFSGGTPSSASGAGPHNVSWSTAGSKNVSLTVSKSGCSNNNTSTSVSVGTNFTTPIISGTRSTTTNTSENFSVTAVTGATYNWTPDIGGTVTGTGNSISISYSSTGSKLIDLTINNSGCIKSDTHLLVVNIPPCYSSESNFGGLTLGTSMNNYGITDGAGTTATFGRSNASSGNSFHILGGTLTFPRSGDTAVTWSNYVKTTWDSAWITFNTGVQELSFSVRDIDRNGGSYVDSVYVVMYKSDGTKLGLSTINAAYNSTYIGLKGEVFYCSVTNYQAAYNANDCDITFSLPAGISVNKVVVYRRQNTTNGSFVLDMGISELDWCTNVPLPVNFIGVDAKLAEDGSVLVSWSTGSEQNNQYFSIEKATDESSFESLATITGAGNSQTVKHYRFLDYTTKSGIQYYRIKQTDFDGKFGYSPVVSVHIAAFPNAASLNPNPFTDMLNISLTNTLSGNGVITVFGVDGRRILETPVSIIAGKSSVNLSSLPNGLYFINVEFESELILIQKIVKK